jgi:hypothetical protein
MCVTKSNGCTEDTDCAGGLTCQSSKCALPASSSSTPVTSIIGIALGLLSLLMVVIGAILFLRYKRKHKSNKLLRFPNGKPDAAPRVVEVQQHRSDEVSVDDQGSSTRYDYNSAEVFPYYNSQTGAYYQNAPYYYAPVDHGFVPSAVPSRNTSPADLAQYTVDTQAGFVPLILGSKGVSLEGVSPLLASQNSPDELPMYSDTMRRSEVIRFERMASELDMPHLLHKRACGITMAMLATMNQVDADLLMLSEEEIKRIKTYVRTLGEI